MSLYELSARTLVTLRTDEWRKKGEVNVKSAYTAILAVIRCHTSILAGLVEGTCVIRTSSLIVSECLKLGRRATAPPGAERVPGSPNVLSSSPRPITRTLVNIDDDVSYTATQIQTISCHVIAVPKCMQYAPKCTPSWRF